jgi:hypothetical protein
VDENTHQTETCDITKQQQSLQNLSGKQDGSCTRSSSSVSSCEGNAPSNYTSSNHGNATSPTAAAKTFNPFPSRLMNPKRAQNGVRLGLYSPESLPIPDKNNAKKSCGMKNISRAQLNACLHRHYITEIKQQAKTK